MIEVLSNPFIRYKYIVQTPDVFSEDIHYQVIFYFHGSLNGTFEENVSRIYKEYENGRWIFSQKINAFCIFVTPIIQREAGMNLSNGLEVDPQRLSRGCVHQRCKEEFPGFYAPHLEIKKILDGIRKDLGSKCRLRNKVITIGLSAGGSLATRFALLYPEDVCNALSLINEQLIMPAEKYDSLELPFPFGLAGLEECPDVKLDEKKISDYLRIPKLILIDRRDESDSLPWDIDEEFFKSYTSLFGDELYKRAWNLAEILCSKFKDSVELVITTGNGHKVLNEDFDAHVERYVYRSLRLD